MNTNIRNSTRRHVVGLLALSPLGVWSPDAAAHHGWSSFDQERPLYLEGVATEIRWRNPHAEFTLEVKAPLALPTDLANRVIPAQSAPVNAVQLMATTRLPEQRASRWTIELAPLSRLSQWQLQEIREGTSLAVVGFALRTPQPTPLMRVEFLFLGGRAYPMRSSPA
jgi:hypothetical protein